MKSESEGKKVDSDNLGTLNNKGKWKKWKKRIEKGEVNSSSSYFLCRYDFSFKTSPTVKLLKKKLPTNPINSKHDLDLNELRCLIKSVLLKESNEILSQESSRIFKITNAGYLRYVLLIHFEEASGDTSVENESKLIRFPGIEKLSLRVSKDLDRVHSLPYRLLTEVQRGCCKEPSSSSSSSSTHVDDVKSNADQNSSESNKRYNIFKSFIFSRATLLKWGFPIDAAEAEVAVITNESISNSLPQVSSQDNPLKRPRLIGECNYMQYQSLPSAEEASFLLAMLKGESTSKTSFPFVKTLSTGDPRRMGLLGSLQGMKPLSIVALDCEMVELVGGKSAVARISVLDGSVKTDGELVLDTLVRPASKISDYRTPFSGITPDMFQDSTSFPTLEQIQLWLLRIISSETILVGHSLENDLSCLGLSHACVVDTSLLFPHCRGFPHRRGLRVLVGEFLGEELRPSTKGLGHDSIQDAQAALRLANLKVERGAMFGIPKSLCDEYRVSLDEAFGDYKHISFSHFSILSDNFCRDDPSPPSLSIRADRESRPLSCSKEFLSIDSDKTVESINRIIEATNADCAERAKDDTSFCLLSLYGNSESFAAFLSQLVQTLKESNRRGLLIFTSQRNTAAINKLANRQRINQSQPMSTICWSAELESLLRKEIMKAHNAELALVTV